MADSTQEIKKLRNNIAKVIFGLEVWATLYDVCRSLGFSVDVEISGLGKEKYLNKITSEASESNIISAAQKILTNYPGTRGKPSDSDLQLIQDSLWWIEKQGIQRFSNVTRYLVAESLEGVRFWGRLSLRDILEPTIPITMGMHLPEIGNDGNLYLDLSSSLFGLFLSGSKNSTPPGASRISVQDFLKGIGLIEWPDKRFCLFLERIVHPEVQPPDKQEQLVAKLNSLLQNDGFELQQNEIQGGFPVYKVQKIGLGVSGAPKYIIFASDGPKPDIVINDAVNMDIRIVRFADQCLIYDQPPPNGDLTWAMLLEWWGKKKLCDPENEDFRREFGFRLRASLQSEPERMLFDTYFKVFKPKMGDNLPALLPQVYLHYDPRNKNERDKPVLARQRMDFLLLLRNSARIVIEIDGVQHYSNDDGYASTTKYSEMVAEDRRIRLLGYEVYRFGGAEFTSPTINQIIAAFFEELFRRHIL
jgi:very-short-patch-repair endonuclease